MITISTDIAGDDNGRNTIVTVAQTVDIVRIRAGLPPESVLGVRVIHWHGPAGGNPEIEITFRERTDAEMWTQELFDDDATIDWRGHIVW